MSRLALVIMSVGVSAAVVVWFSTGKEEEDILARAIAKGIGGTR